LGPTLFRYIFKDLFKVFLLSMLVIAGIMSFAGLLRPLAERGLDGGQMLRMLAWLLPAMATYSLPVAAVFATTFVYGRLAADNEIVAMRAAGIPTGLIGLSFPALVLGAGAFAVSFGLLSFVVPAANLQVERVVYSNLAQLSANEINRTKRLSFGSASGHLTLTADSAVVIDPAELAAGSSVAAQTQIVQLVNVYVLRYENVGSRQEPYDVPREIYSARRATAFIEPPSYYRDGEVFETGLREDRFLLTVVLEGGVKFPRSFEGATEAPLVAAVSASQVGPLPMESPVGQNTKFLDLRELRQLYQNPELGRDVGGRLRELAEREQRLGYLARLRTTAAAGGETLRAAEGVFRFTTLGAETVVSEERIELTAGSEGLIELIQQRDQETLTISAPRAAVSAQPLRLAEGPRMLVVFSFEDATVTIDPAEGEAVTTHGRPFERRALIEMPQDLASLPERGIELLSQTTLQGPEIDEVNARRLRQTNAVYAEIHSRVSFALSCLILPVVGGILGMLFRSGNFLTAFAVCAVPAMLSIVLIVVGQHIAENVPEKLGPGRWTNPLTPGLLLIWAGNFAVAAAAVALLVRLRRA
jgi:lipopolysaccharide export LptBFGC system permease protein LptF